MKTLSKFCLLIILFGCNIAFGQTHNEILGRPTDSTITVSVLFNQVVDLYIEYGTVSGIYPNSTTQITNVSGTPNNIDLQNLLPNTKYYYRVRYRLSGPGPFLASVEHSFHTQRAIGSTFTFDVEADEHLYDYGDPGLYNITLHNESLDNPDFLISLGDTFGDDHYPWTITSHDCDSLHLLYRSRLGNICHSVPFYFCLGNHEGEKDFYLDSMPPNNLAIWSTLARKFYYPNPYPNNFYSGDTLHEGYGIGQAENYYAWTWGNALFVVLDVYRYDCYDEDTTTNAKPGGWDWTLGQTEYLWLKHTLETSTAQYKFVFAHHVSGESRGGIVPAKLFEWGGYNKNGTTWGFTQNRPGWAKPIHKLFHDNGVNIFFQGHDHLFAHEVLDSVTYQEVPMAADSTYIKGMSANSSAYTADTLDASGHMRVTVSPQCIQVDYVRAWLPADTVSHVHHNREVSFSYTIGNCQLTGIKDVSKNTFINVYPNPASNSIFVQTDTPKDYDRQIVLINIVGETVITQELKSGNVLAGIDVSKIPSGLYYVKVFDGKDFRVFKIVVTK